MSEAIEAAKRILAAVRKCEHTVATWYELTGDDCVGLEAPYEVAAELLRLAEPEWGEPKEEHDGVACWVEGVSDRMPLMLTRDPTIGTWCMLGQFPSERDGVWNFTYERLGGRRVAPCVGRPRKAGE